jgi:glycosyltransferase involved in cell wall biosynthesis
MNIWILNHYALPPEAGGGTRHFDFAAALRRRGHDVTIVASSIHYATHKQMRDYGEKDYLVEMLDGVRFVWLKTPPYSGNGIGRVRNMLAYTRSAIRLLPRMDIPAPDVVVGSSVHLFAVYAAYRLARRYGVPFVMEVRDLWPETLIEFGMSRYHPFVVLLGVTERFLYRKADKIVSLLPFAYEHIGRYTDPSKVVWISNGTDTRRIAYVPPAKKPTLDVCYAGTMGTANNLDVLLDAASLLRERDDIRFRLYGEGPLKEKLLRRVLEERLHNVTLEDAVPKEEVGGLLASCDVLYVGLKDTPLYRYGMSMNKIYDYMAAGRPVVFAAASRNDPLKEAGVGYSVAPDNAEAIRDALVRIAELPIERRRELGEKARKFVEAHYDVEVLAERFEKVLQEVIKGA